MMSTGGDSSLGGDDFDNLIFEDCVNKLALQNLSASQIQIIRQFANLQKSSYLQKMLPSLKLKISTTKSLSLILKPWLKTLSKEPYALPKER